MQSSKYAALRECIRHFVDTVDGDLGPAIIGQKSINKTHFMSLAADVGIIEDYGGLGDLQELKTVKAALEVRNGIFFSLKKMPAAKIVFENAKKIRMEAERAAASIRPPDGLDVRTRIAELAKGYSQLKSDFLKNLSEPPAHARGMKNYAPELYVKFNHESSGILDEIVALNPDLDEGGYKGLRDTLKICITSARFYAKTASDLVRLANIPDDFMSKVMIEYGDVGGVGPQHSEQELPVETRTDVGDTDISELEKLLNDVKDVLVFATENDGKDMYLKYPPEYMERLYKSLKDELAGSQYNDRFEDTIFILRMMDTYRDDPQGLYNATKDFANNLTMDLQSSKGEAKRRERFEKLGRK
jgi:hypothetical protein